MSNPSHHVWLHRYALLLAAATFCLIIAGALVTSNDAGLAVPDWPLSYGKLMPPMVGGIFTSFVLELVVYPAIYQIWKWNFEVKEQVARRSAGGLALQG